MSNVEEEAGNQATPRNSPDSQNLFFQPESVQTDLSFELSYEPTSQSSFDPYGFKLSPEHSSHTLLDPDEAELSPEATDQDLSFDPEPSSPQPEQLNFDPYEFDITSSQTVRDTDPYGFKLSPEEENQEVLDLCCQDNQEAMDQCGFDDKEPTEPFNYSNQEVLEPHNHENQEVLEHCSNNNQELLDLCDNGNQEVLEHSSLDNRDIVELVGHENQELLDLDCHDNQEVVEPNHIRCDTGLEPYSNDNQEVLEPCSLQLLDFCCPENQEVLDLDGNQEQVDCGGEGNQEGGGRDNQELLDFSSNERKELLDLDLGSHDNQQVMDLFGEEVPSETNNNRRVLEREPVVSPPNNSSDSDAASEDLLGLELSNSSICTANITNTNHAGNRIIAVSNTSANQVLPACNAPTSHSLLEGDLGSVFGAGGYVGCPDVADDLEPLDHRQVNAVPEPVRPVRPVRPPRPSLKVSWKPTHTSRIHWSPLHRGPHGL